MAAAEQTRVEKKPISLFDLSPDFSDSITLLRSKRSSAHPSVPSSLPPTFDAPLESSKTTGDSAADVEKRNDSKGKEPVSSRWTCHTCRGEFESLHDQRSHFKSDLHRLNVKLSLAGKKCIKEEDFEGLDLDNNSLLEELEVSSISGSEDESDEDESQSLPVKLTLKNKENFKQKLYFNHPTGETISVYKCFLVDESEHISYSSSQTNEPNTISQEEILTRLKKLISEPRDKTSLRIVLLASGGHFAGSVFDGKSILAHKTFHRYVVRAKAGKKQSSKDGTGKVAHSAGSSIRRHNEAALKKEIQELMVLWKNYFDNCKSVLIHAPLELRRVLFDGDKLLHSAIAEKRILRNVPLTVRRPTFKETKRIYELLSQFSFEPQEDKIDDIITTTTTTAARQLQPIKETIKEEITESLSDSDNADISEESKLTELHVAARSGDVAKVLELLEGGIDPCAKDERGKTAYMVANDKEVRNGFRRFMASNLDKWDWHAANVPSPLTPEMEESQAAKQAEKDAKRKARAKELKKIKKARDKEKEKEKAKQEEEAKQREETIRREKEKAKPSWMPAVLSEEERERRLKEEREKRAAAAERRMAGMRLEERSENGCSYCRASLDGKVPFHRYSFKYCSPTCMHVHGESL